MATIYDMIADARFLLRKIEEEILAREIGS